ncbi:hypothetical protein [Psychroflexus sp. ALD_RP9]|uniref:hypothetical protein n=1 Tax=Psychroflexus sp. ALD_RP9 TaxID=2777186 RepID=UPI001A8F2DF4|nr:hypothetical protein [Psychroflexus sp. ALD_RP9]QSS96332.1 hypothetical protein IMZ30_07640 [Psychroflexus sp. ALD_RP9]
MYTSWNLTEIQLLNGKKISFNYHPESHYLTYNTVKDEHANGQLTTTINVTKNIERYLKSITYHKTRVEFIYSQDNREDIYNDQNGAKALERIKVFMRKDNSAVLNKDIELKQSYFSSTTQSEQNLPNYFNSGNHSLFSHAQKRLRLDEVINHHLSDTSESLRYKFNYNSTAIAHKFTTAQDYWGYYNGADNGNNLVFGEADRRVNPTYTKLGLIESVEYPTGLVKKFTYEPQAGYISSKLQHLETELINPSGQNPTNHVSASPLNYNTYFNHSQNAYIIPFNIGNDATNFSYKVEKTDFYTSENSQSNSNVIYLFKIINPVNNTIVWDYRLDETDCLTTESFQQGRSCDGSWNWTPSLPTGNYVLKVETESGNYDPESYEGFNFIMNWEDNEYPEHYLVGPGSRVKQIESYETGSPRNLAVDQFDYETDLGKDSGYIFGLPNYFVSFDYPSAPSTGPDNTYDVITGNYTNSLFNNFQGRKHVYSQVIVKTGTKTAQQNNGEGINIPTDIYHFNGEKVLSYSVNDDFNDFTDYPFVLADSNSWIDGQLLNERSFSYSKNGNKQLLKEVDYHYSVDYESHESLLTNGPSFMHPDQGNLSGNTINQNYSDVFQSPHWSKGHSWKIPLAAFYYEGFPFNVNATVPVNYKVYYITGGYLKLNSVTEDRYYYKNSSTHKVSTTTHFEYYNSEFNFSTKSKDYVSYNDGTIIEQSKTNYYYPDILPQWYNTDWNVQALIDDHRISSPIAVVTYNNNTLTSRLAKQFDPSPILKETFFSKGKQALDSKIKYEQYDQDSNVLQVRQTGDVPISYIYGYHNSKPIAKLVNIAYNQINPSLISSLQAAADADANCLGANCQQTEDDLRNLLEQLRSTYSNAQITTYTYDPLIGVTSVTDPRGQSLYYEYGAFNRLERIKDEQGHIVEEYDYNYRQTSNQ